ncbi:hypothetical protein NC796_20145 [Aliifodinibius sp. S!AR15-10]|uniref:hypothetical protein n=1 Tax=Aliifodinibius sp. S!AR15-10 TaxID=2950437 RepID=UPI0028582EC0|nr:hypothetical protein [Aliifodinibius sp. S!AR15-10]MDR8393477.1 hypothetical protein [Aliifodinibius sp. S!AR15-10]
MFTGGFNDEIWDEYKWEAHLDEIEKKSNQLRRFIAPDPTGNIPRWVTLLQENRDELDAVDAFIEEELQIEEAYFPDEEDEEWDDDYEDELDDFFAEDEYEDDFFFDEEEEDFDYGEEWKELSNDFTMSEHGSIDTLEIYNTARGLAAYILQWAEGVHTKYRSDEYYDFVGNVLKIGAKLAAGYSFGFEQDFLGGNIAYTKKGLHCTNMSLVLLQDHLKQAPFINKEEYLLLHEQLFELRNDIGIYVQELREQFYLGLE